MNNKSNEPTVPQEVADWLNFSENAQGFIKARIEENYEDWRNSDKEFALVATINLVKGKVGGTGRVTGSAYIIVYADKVKDLEAVWSHEMILQSYDTTRNHFIINTKTKKVVKMLSFCA